MAEQVTALHGVEQDWKVRELVRAVKKLLKDGYHPIIFCRYIATANYVGADSSRRAPATWTSRP